MAADCGYQFHGISRTELAGGQVRLDLAGWSYPASGERAAAPQPCATRTVPPQMTEWDGKPVRLVETRDACEMVAEHIGYPYTPIWQGRGWTVELRSGYPLWQTTS